MFKYTTLNLVEILLDTPRSRLLVERLPDGVIFCYFVSNGNLYMDVAYPVKLNGIRQWLPLFSVPSNDQIHTDIEKLLSKWNLVEPIFRRVFRTAQPL